MLNKIRFQVKRHVTILLLLTLGILDGRSQQTFTQLDWDVLRIDSLLPHYTEVIPLETDYRFYTYSAHILYPEWQELTEREAAVAMRHADELSDTLQLEISVGISRGQGFLDLDFIPIICRDGKFQKLISGKVEIIPTYQGRKLPRKLQTRADEGEESGDENPRWAANSVLSSGRWVKISLTEDGIYHLTTSQLRQMGFSNTQNIRVYGYGGHRQSEIIQADTDWDDLSPVSLLPVSDGYLFHANGLIDWQGDLHKLNHYARAACYFVTEATTAVPSFPEKEGDPSQGGAVSEPTTVRTNTVFDPQEYSWIPSGSQLYESYDYFSGNTRTYTLDLPTYATSDAAKLTIAFSAGNATDTELLPSFNGTALTTTIVSKQGSDYYAARESVTTFDVEAPKPSNTIRLKTTEGQHAHLNYIELNYSAPLRVDASYPYIQFQGSYAPQLAYIEVADGQSPEVWQLDSNREAAKRVATNTITGTNGRRFLVADLGSDREDHRFVVFDASSPSVFRQPSVVGTVANQNLHTTDSLDMVIITPASGQLDAQAERLAEVHRALDGFRIGIFRADQIYNEFSSGTPDATAYRRFLKMLYDRGLADDTAPRYLLLFGDCAWDNRMVTSPWRPYNPDHFLLCYESDNSLHKIDSYVMEDYFGLLDDGEGRYLKRDKCDLGIGRISVRSAKEAATVVDKIIRYIYSEEAGAWKNVVCFMGDDGDRNLHEEMAEDAANLVAKAHPELEVRKIIWDAYTRESTASGFRYPEIRQVIKRQMEEGALMMNYTGHASYYTMSHEQVILVEDFLSFTAPRPPFWFTAACDVMPFDTQQDNFGETALFNSTGAAIAFYGTTRTVTAHENSPLNMAYCKALFGTDEQGRPCRLGDAGRIAKVNVINAGQVGVNKLHYALLGDPALRLCGPTNRVILDSINGVAIDKLPDDFMLHAGGVAHLAGHVADAEGQDLNTFQGTLSVRFYDSQSSITCNKYDATSYNAFAFSTYDKILYNGLDSIRNGRFALSCPIPLDIKYSNDPGRLLFYALSSDRLSEANGYSHDFLLGGTESDLNDTEGPKILAVLGGDDFQDGGEVGATPYFQATLEDESGINTSGNGLGHDLELVVDNDATRTYNLNDYFVQEIGDYRRGTVAYSLPALDAGPHQLTFRAWDMLNNANSQSLNFTVNPSKAMHLTQLRASSNPARTSTQFILTYDRPGSTCAFTIEVFDFTGRVLWRHTTTGSSSSGLYTIPWDLTTNAGTPVHTGVYLFRARVSCDESEEATQAQKLIINRSF